MSGFGSALNIVGLNLGNSGPNEQGTATGAFSGAVAGGMATGGNPIGIIGGAIIGGALGNMQSDSARVAQKNAQKAADRARRDTMVQEMGAKQQADSIALAGLARNNNTGSPDKPGGLMGQNINTAGTF